MADKPVDAIAAELVAVPSTAFAGKEDLRAPPCVACGTRTHGGIGAHIQCLETHVRRLRTQLATAQGALAEFQSLK